jgi:hypothetical protein
MRNAQKLGFSITETQKNFVNLYSVLQSLSGNLIDEECSKIRAAQSLKHRRIL